MFFLVSTVLLPAQQTAHVKVQFQTGHSFGGNGELDRAKFFNVHGSYTSSALTVEDLQQLQDLNIGFGRSFDGPFAGHELGDPYPDTTTIRTTGAKVIAAAEADSRYKFHTNRRLVTDEVQTVFNMEDDPKEMARYAVDILEYHYTDATRPGFYSPLSIPFVAADRYGEDDALVRERMSQFIAEVAEEVDRRGLATQVIGYTSAWPMMHFWDFGHWRSRMQLFIDIAGDHLDAICFLLMDASHYDGPDKRRSGSRVEALMDLIETYGFTKWAEPKPFAFSEYGAVAHGWPKGDAYSPARASAELNAYNHFLFSLLGREDRVAIAIPFITTKSPWFYRNPKNNWQPYSADLWRPDPESIIDRRPTRFLETEKMDFYRLWQDVRGQRVCADSDHPDVVSFAYVDGKDAYLCLNNSETLQQEVSLGFLGRLPEVERVELKRMYVPKGQAVQYAVDHLQAVPLKIVLKSYETIVLRISFIDSVERSDERVTRTHYSENLLQPITANEVIAFKIAALDLKSSSDGTLRVSLAREHELSKQPQLTVNGHELEFPSNWLGDDQSNREGGFFGAIEMPIPAAVLRPQNEVKLVFADTGGRVSTVVIESHTVR